MDIVQKKKTKNPTTSARLASEAKSAIYILYTWIYIYLFYKLS